MDAMTWLTFALVAITAVYAGLTYWLASSTARQLWETNRAQLVAVLSLHQGSNVVHLVIRNVGRGIAKDCRLTVDKPVHSAFDTTPLDAMAAFKRSVPAFPPGFDWHYTLGTAIEYLADQGREKHPLMFTIHADYETGGKRVRESHVVDVEALLCGPAERDDAATFFYKFPQLFERKLDALTAAAKKR